MEVVAVRRPFALLTAFAVGIGLLVVAIAPASATVPSGIGGYLHELRCNLTEQVYDWDAINGTSQDVIVKMYVNGVLSPEDTAYPAGFNNSGTTAVGVNLPTGSDYTLTMTVNDEPFLTTTGKAPLCVGIDVSASYISQPYCSAGQQVADWQFANNTNGFPTFDMQNNSVSLLSSDPGVTPYQLGSGTVNIDGSVGTSYSITALVNGVQDGPAITGTVADCGVISPPPTIDSGPTISGTAQVGSQLTASATYSANVSAATFQWYNGITPITGASLNTYTLTAAEYGAVVTCKLTVSDGVTSVSATSAAVTVASAPVFSVLPKTTGYARVASQLTATATLTNSAAPTFQWFSGGTAVTGATQASFLLSAADYGKLVFVKVTGSDGFTTVSATSTAVKVAAGLAPVAKVKPIIIGKATVGSTLKLKSFGVWSPKPTGYKCQWVRLVGKKVVLIKYATKTSYKLTKADKKYRVALLVSTVKTGYATGKSYSVYTAIIK
jgi:hypothetical protein